MTVRNIWNNRGWAGRRRPSGRTEEEAQRIAVAMLHSAAFRATGRDQADGQG